YKFSLKATDASGNINEYSRNFNIGIKTDFEVVSGTVITPDSSLFSGLINEPDKYDFSYTLIKSLVSNDRVLAGNSFVVDGSGVYYIKAVATNKTDANDVITQKFSYHTSDVKHITLNEEKNSVAMYIRTNNTGELSCGLKNDEGDVVINASYSAARVDGRTYFVITGLEPNKTYEYLSFGCKLTTPEIVHNKVLSISFYPTIEVGRKLECKIISGAGTEFTKVRIPKAMTDENGILCIYTFIYCSMDITFSDINLYQKLENNYNTTLNGYNFTFCPNGALVDCENEDDVLSTSWYSETSQPRAGFAISGLESGEHYNVSFDATAEGADTATHFVLYYDSESSGNNHYGFLRLTDKKRTFIIPNLTADENGMIYYEGMYVHNDTTIEFSNLVVREQNEDVEAVYDGLSVSLKAVSQHDDLYCAVNQEGNLVSYVGTRRMGHESGKRPEMKISGLIPNLTYQITIGINVKSRTESFQLVLFKNSTATGNDYYKLIQAEGQFTFTVEMTSNEQGEIVFNGWYGSAGLYIEWDISAEFIYGTYGDYAMTLVNMYPKANNASGDSFVNSVSGEKLVTTTTGSIGNARNAGKGPRLMMMGLKPNTYYTASVNINTSGGILCFYNDRNTGTNIGNATKTVEFTFRTDENGTGYWANWYGQSGVTITWNSLSVTESTAVEYGDYSLSFVNYYYSVGDRFTSVEENGKLKTTTTSNIGNGRNSGYGPRLTVSGLIAGKEYTITVNFTTANGTLAYYAAETEGSAINYSNKSGSITFTKTADENGEVFFTGFYGTNGLIITWDSVIVNVVE
ncbi:MAG: hypothetical protein J6Y43_06760, partial [Clostridia bacterium]|nr:hypothetical protein [Clostridia bacterium]